MIIKIYCLAILLNQFYFYESNIYLFDDQNLFYCNFKIIQVQLIEMSCKSPSLIGELISCDLLVSHNQSNLTLSLDYGDGTNETFTF